MQQINRNNIYRLANQSIVAVPLKETFGLPEKVLQFGTGVLLRGLPDYFIHKANQQGIFNGRIVVVKSTEGGDFNAFEEQDGLYTLCVRGIEKEQEVVQNIINNSISRVIEAKSQWKEVVRLAASPTLEIVISNTTEVGITFTKESIFNNPPQSYPGKLLAVLYHRFNYFKGDKDKGLIIIPTELVSNNGTELKGIVTELAVYNQLSETFIHWLDIANEFCNSLVDRIVPGKLSEAMVNILQPQLGYSDKLMIMAEVYRLWAIETTSLRTREMLSFSKTDNGVIITADITAYKELKLRLLNGSHSATCALAIQSGFGTVKEAMNNERFHVHIKSLMEQEIAPSIISNDITLAQALQFSVNVRERYSNPFLEHKWSSIAVQYTSKLRLRIIPVIKNYVERTHKLPPKLIEGIAAYLLLLRTVKEGGEYKVVAGNEEIVITDQNSGDIYLKWQQYREEELVHAVFKEETIWGENLTLIPGFVAAIWMELHKMIAR